VAQRLDFDAGLPAAAFGAVLSEAALGRGLFHRLHHFRFIVRGRRHLALDRLFRLGGLAGDTVDEDYFRKRIEPLLGDPLIKFIGEIDEPQKAAFLGGARALLFPIDWPEPFGPVMIEAMSAGTPVIAWRNGSVPEIVREGVSGFIVDSNSDAVAACERSAAMDRL